MGFSVDILVEIVCFWQLCLARRLSACPCIYGDPHIYIYIYVSLVSVPVKDSTQIWQMQMNHIYIYISCNRGGPADTLHGFHDELKLALELRMP